MPTQERQTRTKNTTQKTLFDDRITTLDTSMVGDVALLASLNKSLIGIAGPNGQNKTLHDIFDTTIPGKEHKFYQTAHTRIYNSLLQSSLQGRKAFLQPT